MKAKLLASPQRWVTYTNLLYSSTFQYLDLMMVVEETVVKEPIIIQRTQQEPVKPVTEWRLGLQHLVWMCEVLTTMFCKETWRTSHSERTSIHLQCNFYCMYFTLFKDVKSGSVRQRGRVLQSVGTSSSILRPGIQISPKQCELKELMSHWRYMRRSSIPGINFLLEFVRWENDLIAETSSLFLTKTMQINKLQRVVTASGHRASNVICSFTITLFINKLLYQFIFLFTYIWWGIF